jgi:hypothetical protein
VILAALVATVAAAAAWPSDAELEAAGARIGSIVIRDQPIFDPAHQSEKKAIYRLADRLHIDTHTVVIERELLFRSGDFYSRRLLDETERNLRQLRYLREPEIRIVGYRDGVVDLEVVVHEVWTTSPGLSFGRRGGENASGVSLEELNLLGLGKQLAFDYSDDVDRRSYTLRWRDPDIHGTRWRSAISLRDSDDGTAQAFELDRPFYSLDARWSARMAVSRDDSVERVYRLGEHVAGYARERETAALELGWSDGLRDGWTRRWTAGFRQQRATFAFDAAETGPAVLPQDRALDHVILGFEAVQDDFETARNRDHIARTEDFQFGWRWSAELGFATPAFGADRSAALIFAEMTRGIRLASESSLFLDGWTRGRVESGGLADALIGGSLRCYVPTGSKGTFFAALSADAGRALDADREVSLGGDSGLRGYPLRYQSGSGRALLTLEQRFYTGRSIWRLADIGGAVFVDMGRSWGDSAFGPTGNLGLLKDVGIGLRLGSRKSALANVLHIDLAFPLDGPGTLDRAQLLIQTKRSF